MIDSRDTVAMRSIPMLVGVERRRQAIRVEKGIVVL
jgi:hypothetical protein